MTVYTKYPRYAVYPVPYMTLSHRFRNRMTVYGFQQAVYLRRIFGHLRRIYGENRIWTVYRPYMFEGLKKLQAFEGLKNSDFRHNLLIHQFLCLIVMEGKVNGSSGGPGGGCGASEVTAVTAKCQNASCTAKCQNASHRPVLYARMQYMFGMFSRKMDPIHASAHMHSPFYHATGQKGITTKPVYTCFACTQYKHIPTHPPSQLP
jgi:hypothetical protein